MTCEVARLCTDGTPNACSALYGACARIAGTACKECVKSKDWKNFRWNGTAGPEEELHE